mmetsp:Transcript_11422/g.17186  ORF Transcript_11422/g.17186 Transcript_11422/m.17186 type:complete len:579 (-) Transcript_11422:176-1912(-)
MRHPSCALLALLLGAHTGVEVVNSQSYPPSPSYPSPSIPSSPSLDIAPSPPTTSGGDQCSDAPGWADADGNDCAWYAAYHGRCSEFAGCCEAPDANGNNYTAFNACCACGGGGSIDALYTTLDGGNGSRGNMFDIITYRDIRLRSFSIHSDDENYITIDIFLAAGPYKDYQYSSSFWFKIYDGTSYSDTAPSGSFTHFPDDSLSVDLVGGRTFGMYITNSYYDEFQYSNGSKEGRIFVSNEHLAITEGAGVGGYFSSFYSPRVWNGGLRYTAKQVDTEQPSAPPANYNYPSANYNKNVGTTLTMTLHGVPPLPSSEQRTWEIVTQNVIEDADTSEVRISDAEVEFLEQDPPLGNSTSSFRRLLQSAQNTIMRRTQSSLKIRYNVTLDYVVNDDTTEETVDLKAVVEAPFSSEELLENYAKLLRNADPDSEALSQLEYVTIESSSGSDDDNTLWIIIGCSIGGTLILCCCAAGACFAMRRKGQKSANKAQPELQSTPPMVGEAIEAVLEEQTPSVASGGSNTHPYATNTVVSQLTDTSNTQPTMATTMVRTKKVTTRVERPDGTITITTVEEPVMEENP